MGTYRFKGVGGWSHLRRLVKRNQSSSLPMWANVRRQKLLD